MRGFAAQLPGGKDNPAGLPPKPSIKPPVKATVPKAPLTLAQQAQAQTTALYAPLLKQITDSIAQRSTQGQQAVTGYSSALAQLLSGLAPQSQQAYTQAQGQTAAANAALSAELRGAGSDVAAGLADRLKAVGADPTAAAAQQAQIGQGSAGALYGSGTADLNRLISQGANAQDYFNKQPGIAALGGLQSSRQLEEQLSQELGQKLGDLQAKQPDTYQQLLQGLQTAKAQATSNAIAQQVANFNMGLDTKKVNISQQNANTSAKNASISEARLAAAQANSDRSYNLAVAKFNTATAVKANASLSKALGYVVDGAGNPILRNGNRVKVKTATAANGRPLGLTPVKWQQFNSQALGAARNYHKTWTDANDVAQEPLSWQDYLTHGENAGIPISILIRQGQKVYSPGERRQGLLPQGG